MRTLALFVVALVVWLALKPAPKASGIGPTMIVLTNVIQSAPTPSGPWTDVQYTWATFLVVPGTKFFRGRLESSSHFNE